MNLLIKDNFFSNPDVLRRFALDCDYIDSEEVKVDVGWRGHRTDEFEVIGNPHLITASEKLRRLYQILRIKNIISTSVITQGSYI